MQLRYNVDDSKVPADLQTRPYPDKRAKQNTSDSDTTQRLIDSDTTQSLSDSGIGECGDLALHLSLVVFLSIMLISCVYICRKPSRRRLKVKSVETQTDEVDAYFKECSSSRASSPAHPSSPARHSSLARPSQLCRLTSEENSGLAASLSSIQSLASSSNSRPKRGSRKVFTMIPSNSVSHIVTEDTCKISMGTPDSRTRRITMEILTPNLARSANKSNSEHAGDSYNPLRDVFSTSDGNLIKSSGSYYGIYGRQLD